jgi:hypothetical protein
MLHLDFERTVNALVTASMTAAAGKAHRPAGEFKKVRPVA